MQVISQKVSTINSPMPIKNTEIGNFFKLHTVLWFGNVKNNGDSIFVILTYWSLVGGCSIGLDIPIGFEGMFGFLKIRNCIEYFG
jgi:hypothetical protein